MKHVIFSILFLTAIYAAPVYVAGGVITVTNVAGTVTVTPSGGFIGVSNVNRPVVVAIVTNTVNAAVSNVVTVSPSNGFMLVSNVGAQLVYASNLTVQNEVTNEVDVDITKAITLCITQGDAVYTIVSNTPAVSQGGVFSVIVSNTPAFSQGGVFNVIVSNTPAVSQGGVFSVIASNTVAVSQGGVFRNMVTNLPTDPLGGLHIIDHVHHELHEGCMYRSTIYTEALANAAITAAQLIATTKNIHYFIDIGVGGNCTYFVYQDPLTTNGTVVTNSSFNLNGYSANTPSTYLVRSPLYTNTGTLRNKVFLNGGTGNGKQGAAYKTEIEVIVKSNTSLLFVVSNQSGTGAIDISKQVFWYEED